MAALTLQCVRSAKTTPGHSSPAAQIGSVAGPPAEPPHRVDGRSAVSDDRRRVTALPLPSSLHPLSLLSPAPSDPLLSSQPAPPRPGSRPGSRSLLVDAFVAEVRPEDHAGTELVVDGRGQPGVVDDLGDLPLVQPHLPDVRPVGGGGGVQVSTGGGHRSVLEGTVGEGSGVSPLGGVLRATGEKRSVLGEKVRSGTQ